MILLLLHFVCLQNQHVGDASRFGCQPNPRSPPWSAWWLSLGKHFFRRLSSSRKPCSRILCARVLSFQMNLPLFALESSEMMSCLYLSSYRVRDFFSPNPFNNYSCSVSIFPDHNLNYVHTQFLATSLFFSISPPLFSHFSCKMWLKAVSTNHIKACVLCCLEIPLPSNLIQHFKIQLFSRSQRMNNTQPDSLSESNMNTR